MDPERLPALAVGLRVNVFENPDGFEDEAGAGVKSHRPSAAKKLNAVGPVGYCSPHHMIHKKQASKVYWMTWWAISVRFSALQR